MRRLVPLALLGLAMALPTPPADARAIGGCTITPGTVCIGANLQGAQLRGAKLRNATLRKSNLRRADLRKADLRNADLRKADLRNADLRGARLTGARTAGARLTGALLANTILDPALLHPPPAQVPANAGPGGGTALPDPTSLILPYAAAADLERIGPKVTAAYAAAYGMPFQFHNGIDFVASRDLVPFRSMTHATVLVVEVVPNGANEQVSVRVDAGGGFTVVYGFEPMAGAVGQAQLAQIAVRPGDRLEPGTPLGNLLKPGANAAHLHVHMQPSGTSDPICLADRWSAADRTAALTLLTAGYAPPQLCYG